MMVSAGSAVWPIVSHPPVTERPYVNLSGSNSRWILGMGAGESQRIVNYLLDAINRPDHQVRLRWRPNTIAIWDNWGSQHHAAGDHPTYRRVMRRVAVDTDRRLDPRVAERSTITIS
jgi:taurine dioxygenase